MEFYTHEKRKQRPSVVSLSTQSGKFFEHIYGFLMIAERILQKYEEKKPREKNE